MDTPTLPKFKLLALEFNKSVEAGGTVSVAEVLEQVAAVVKEAGHTAELPSLPVINADAHPAEFDFKLPGEPHTVAEEI